MAAKMFTPTKRIATAVPLINDLESGKFPLLLSRILQNLPNQGERAFSEDEEVKLQSSLSLSVDDVHLLLDALTFILKEAAYHIAKPNTLKQELLELGVDENKVNAVVEAWAASSKSTIETLRQQSEAPKQLDSVNWKLNLQMAQSTRSKLKVPCAQFDFGVTSSATQQNEHLTVEFKHEQLYEFYNQLEKIQMELDSLR